MATVTETSAKNSNPNGTESTKATTNIAPVYGKDFEPVKMACPSCKSEITTQVTFEPGTLSWMSCLVCTYLGLVFGCCIIPFLHKRFKDSIHTCPECKQIVKRCNRLSKK